MIFSLRKIAQGDLLERARVLYVIAPSKFTSLSARQGETIESIEDVQNLVDEVNKDNSNFNFKKLFRNIPINARELKLAGKNHKII